MTDENDDAKIKAWCENCQSWEEFEIVPTEGQSVGDQTLLAVSMMCLACGKRIAWNWVGFEARSKVIYDRPQRKPVISTGKVR